MLGYLKRRRQKRVIADHIAQHGGFSFQGGPVDVPDQVGLSIQALVADGGYESAECELIGRHLPRDLPVIELGGCLGLVSNFAIRHVQPGTPYVVVEANPHLVDICRRNATAGTNESDVRLIAKAIAYGTDNVAFNVSDNVHVSRLSEKATHSTATTVPATTLGEIFKDTESRSAVTGSYALICDIEGAEVDLITKDHKTLQFCDAMVIELHPNVYADQGTTLDAVISGIRAAGLTQVDQTENVYAFKRIN